jgi:hypothetical protein
LTAKDLITSGVATAPLKRVEFHAQPLQIQEMFNGTSNLSSQGLFLDGDLGLKKCLKCEISNIPLH